MKQKITRTCFLLFVFLGSFNMSFSQFQKTIDLGGDDYGNVSVPGVNGGHYIVGSTSAHGAANYDAFIVKTDAFGNPQWEKQYGGSGTEWGTSLMSTADGNLLLTGRSNSYGSNYDMFVVKTDTNGVVLWTKTFGTDSDDYGIKAAEGNNVYAIMGSTKGAGGKTDILVVYVDANGNEQFSETLGTDSTNDYAFDILDAGNGFALAGYTSLGALGNDDGCIWVTDYSGNPTVSFMTGGSQHDELRSIIPGDNTIYLAGNTYSHGAGQADYWLVKLNVTGGIPVMMWNKTYGGAQNESLQSAKQVPDGSILLTGLSDSYGSNGEGLIFMVDTNGNAILAKSIGDTSYQDIEGVDIGPSGALFFGSYNAVGAPSDIYLVAPDQLGGTDCNSASQAVSGVAQPDTLVFNFSSFVDTVVIHAASQTLTATANTATLTDLCHQVSAINEVAPQLSFGLYPNPAVKACDLVLYSDNNTSATISIYNYLGEAVKNFNTAVVSGKNTIGLDLTNLASGMYFVKVSTQQAQGVMPLSVE